MKNKSTRIEKINRLQALKQGKLSVSDLQPPQVFIFTERSDEPGVYECDAKKYNETEYREFCERIEKRNNNSISWNERKDYKEEDSIITFRRYKSLNM